MKKNKLLLSLIFPFAFSLVSCTPTNSGNGNTIKDDPMPEATYYEKEEDYLFYSDDYFRHRASRYNEHLATLSIYMAKYSMNVDGPKDASDIDWYQNQPNRLFEFYRLIGFENALCNEDYRARPVFDTIGIAAASRLVTEGDNQFTVIACTVRSGGYFLEWQNNVYMGDGSKSDMMHEGWYNAANKVINFVDYYIKENNISGQIKLWMSGFSRGGAVINIAGGLIDNQLGTNDRETRYTIFEGVNLKREDVLVYTFEAPQGASAYSKDVVNPREPLYNNIFNIVNSNDIVTKFPMKIDFMGFTRFGIDKFITTKFFDPDNFTSNRDVAKKLYAIKNPNYTWIADTFAPQYIPFSDIVKELAQLPIIAHDICYWVQGESPLPEWVAIDDKKRNYDSNIALDVIINELHVGRRDYVDRLQNMAVELMGYIFDDLSSSSTEDLKDIGIKILIQALANDMFSDFNYVINLQALTNAKTEDVQFLYDTLIRVFFTYQTEVISLALNIGNIFENHSTDLNVIFAQSQDSYYIAWATDVKGVENLRKVPYLDDNTYYRFDCYNCDDGVIKVIDRGETEVLKVEGAPLGDSNIKTAQSGFAVGYHNYDSYEKTDWFLPHTHNYSFSFSEYTVRGNYMLYIDVYYYYSSYAWGSSSFNVTYIDSASGNKGPFSGKTDRTQRPPYVPW